MARGMNPGMQIEDDKAGLRPTGIGTGQVRTFSTDLPGFSNAAQIQAGQKVQHLGAELLHHDGQTEARDQALSVPLERDPVTGTYKRPEAPWMGVLSADTYNKVVDQRMSEQISHDFQMQADKIAADHFNNPEKASAAFSALRAGFMKAIPDPKLLGLVTPHIDRELEERFRGIQNTKAHQDYRNEVEWTGKAEQMNEDAAVGFYQAGDMARGDEMFARAQGNREARVALNADDPRMLDLAAIRQTAIKNEAVLYNKLEYELENHPERIPDTVRRLDAMFRGGGSDEDNVLGITKASAQTKFLNQAQKDRIGSRLTRILNDYYVKAEGTKATKDPADYRRTFEANGRSTGKNYDWSDAEDGERTQAYVKTQLPPDASPAQVAEHLWRLRGNFPKGYYEPLFTGAASKGANELAALAGAYNVMQTARDPDGVPVDAGKGVLKDDDAAFMHLFMNEYAHAEGATQEEKAKTAKAAALAVYKEGIDSLKEVRDTTGYTRIVKEYRELQGLPDKSGADLLAEIKPYIDTTRYLDGQDGGLSALGPDDQKELLRSVAVKLAATKGRISFTDAAKEAAAAFRATHHQSDLVLLPGQQKGGGWVKNDVGVPPIQDVRTPGGGSSTDEWVKPYIDSVIHQMNRDGSVRDEKGRLTDPMIPLNQSGYAMKNPRAGVNVFLRETGATVGGANRQFQLVYADGQHMLVIRDKDYKPVTLRLGAAHKLQADEAAKRLGNREYRSQQEERERALRASNEGAAELIKPGPTDYGEQFSAAPGPVDPNLVIDRTSYGPTGEPNLQQTPRSAGGRGRVLSYPKRDDGLPDPLNSLPHQGADLPTGGTVSYDGSEPAQRGFFIPPGGRPGIDGPQMLTTLAKPGTQFRVRNEVGPYAGREVTVHPEFASRLSLMVSSMPREIREEFKFGSVVRSHEQQEGIYRAAQVKRGAEARKWAALPGHSNHEHGIAADLSMGPAAKRWVHQNAERFGLWFPMGHEPWHIEPFGSRRRADLGSDQDAT